MKETNHGEHGGHGEMLELRNPHLPINRVYEYCFFAVFAVPAVVKK